MEIIYNVLFIFCFVCGVLSLLLSIKFFNEKKLLIGIGLSTLGIFFAYLAAIFY